MNYPVEAARRQRRDEINAQPHDRAELAARHGEVWDTEELRRDFVVEGFLAPVVVVRRKCDGQRGSLEFQHRPRFYFGFRPDEG
jgi:hypothetical protein